MKGKTIRSMTNKKDQQNKANTAKSACLALKRLLATLDVKFSDDHEEDADIKKGEGWVQGLCVGLRKADLIRPIFNLDAWSPEHGWAERLAGTFGDCLSMLTRYLSHMGKAKKIGVVSMHSK